MAAACFVFWLSLGFHWLGECFFDCSFLCSFYLQLHLFDIGFCFFYLFWHRLLIVAWLQTLHFIIACSCRYRCLDRITRCRCRSQLVDCALVALFCQIIIGCSHCTMRKQRLIVILGTWTVPTKFFEMGPNGLCQRSRRSYLKNGPDDALWKRMLKLCESLDKLQPWWKNFPAIPKLRGRVPELWGKGNGALWKGSQSSVERVGVSGSTERVPKGSKVLWKRVPKFCGKGRGQWVDGKGPEALWKGSQSSVERAGVCGSTERVPKFYGKGSQSSVEDAGVKKLVTWQTTAHKIAQEHHYGYWPLFLAPCTKLFSIFFSKTNSRDVWQSKLIKLLQYAIYYSGYWTMFSLSMAHKLMWISLPRSIKDVGTSFVPSFTAWFSQVTAWWKYWRHGSLEPVLAAGELWTAQRIVATVPPSSLPRLHWNF